jgi:hypothetical protein
MMARQTSAVTTIGRKFVVTLDTDCMREPRFAALAGSMFTPITVKALLNPSYEKMASLDPRNPRAF